MTEASRGNESVADQMETDRENESVVDQTETGTGTEGWNSQGADDDSSWYW